MVPLNEMSAVGKSIGIGRKPVVPRGLGKRGNESDCLVGTGDPSVGI